MQHQRQIAYIFHIIVYFHYC